MTSETEIDDHTRRRVRMTLLAETFPTLKNAPGVDPWEPHELNRWALGPRSPGERWAARFVLNLWNQSEDWECGSFDVFEALARWDNAHRRAFAMWALNPWWA
jgi:hypothetical protein